MRAGISAVVALRNTTDKPIHINLYPGDEFLGIRCSGPGGNIYKNTTNDSNN